MDAVQRMRKKAQDAGTLKTTEQQKVTTKVVETRQVIVIQQANPQVVYVPAYNPIVVYGPPVYPYPPIYYPPVGYYAAGVAIGVRRRRRDGRVLGRRLGLWPALGIWQRPHQCEQPLREPLQPVQQLQPDRRRQWQLEPQSGTSRRRAVRGPRDRESVRRHDAGGFGGEPEGERRSAESGHGRAADALLRREPEQRQVERRDDRARLEAPAAPRKRSRGEPRRESSSRKRRCQRSRRQSQHSAQQPGDRGREATTRSAGLERPVQTVPQRIVPASAAPPAWALRAPAPAAADAAGKRS